MHQSLHRYQDVARVHLASDNATGGQVRVSDTSGTLVSRGLDSQIMLYQALKMGARNHLHAAVLLGGADERDPIIDD